ncbi:SRPBCC domain-containing protein [uncultured Chitinophaga sp.]|uniref:SRPBCC domain-containing protein n=1 Tax=uncultured Chitinophaga sp. TaxID=339340 RepID=UPI0025D81FCF|nr:SRPBCC domain-containing protein [uncultured Chitinophaga sp.]
MSMLTAHIAINASIEEVWKCWTTPTDIIHWNTPSADWETTGAEVDLQNGGRFLYKMIASDGSVAFNFGGVYNKVVVNEYIECTLSDNRKVINKFAIVDNKVVMTEDFDPESQTPVDEQKAFTQSVLDKFKRYVEGE